MKLLNGLIIYQKARNAIFIQETGRYELKQGPIREQVVVKVIGEDNHCYITRTFEKESFMQKPGIFIYGKFMYGIGFHKTRFVRFIETQLELIYQ